jgi:hypothetical protein
MVCSFPIKQSRFKTTVTFSLPVQHATLPEHFAWRRTDVEALKALSVVS